MRESVDTMSVPQCYFFGRGTCRYGAECRFSHTESHPQLHEAAQDECCASLIEGGDQCSTEAKTLKAQKPSRDEQPKGLRERQQKGDGIEQDLLRRSVTCVLSYAALEVQRAAEQFHRRDAFKERAALRWVSGLKFCSDFGSGLGTSYPELAHELQLPSILHRDYFSVDAFSRYACIVLHCRACMLYD